MSQAERPRTMIPPLSFVEADEAEAGFALAVGTVDFAFFAEAEADFVASDLGGV